MERKSAMYLIQFCLLGNLRVPSFAGKRKAFLSERESTSLEERTYFA